MDLNFKADQFKGYIKIIAQPTSNCNLFLVGLAVSDSGGANQVDHTVSFCFNMFIATSD